MSQSLGMDRSSFKVKHFTFLTHITTAKFPKKTSPSIVESLNCHALDVQHRYRDHRIRRQGLAISGLARDCASIQYVEVFVENSNRAAEPHRTDTFHSCALLLNPAILAITRLYQAQIIKYVPKTTIRTNFI